MIMNEQSTYDADEIYLTDIVLKLWRRRGLIVLLPLLAGGLGLIAVLVMATQARMTISALPLVSVFQAR